MARLWREQPATIRKFVEIRPQYEQLCAEASYILEKRIHSAGIEISSVTSRTKSLRSFAEKLVRKAHREPFDEITDLAGVRVVYLYKADRKAIEEIIEAEFDIIERVDKIEVREPNEFGYGALHYLARVGRKSSGARYDDLRDLVCEIQVRTVLQDAWAIIDHHLAYKQEGDVPKHLIRKLNSLSGLFETADDQFDQIRSEREDYVRAVRGKKSNRGRFLEQELNLDTFREYASWKFKDKPLHYSDTHSLKIFRVAQEHGLKTLSELDRVLQSTRKPRAAAAKDKRTQYAVAEIARALAFAFPDYRKSGPWTDENRARLDKFAHLMPKRDRAG